MYTPKHVTRPDFSINILEWALDERRGFLRSMEGGSIQTDEDQQVIKETMDEIESIVHRLNVASNRKKVLRA